MKTVNTQQWVKWIHEMTGIIYCFACLQLDGCWFMWENVPDAPLHNKCHCRVEAIDYAIVRMNSSSYSSYSKFDPYLFNTTGFYLHGKEKLFEEWGYTVDDAR